MPQSLEVVTEEGPEAEVSVETAIRKWGTRIFALMEGMEARSIFSRGRFYSALMEWAMQDARFKTQLFRFIDVLPSLGSSGAITRHLREYLDGDEVRLSPALRLALRASAAAPWLVGLAVKKQVTNLARQFMLGNDPSEIVAALRGEARQRVAFTVDLLGETVVSEAEADEYVARCLRLLDLLAREGSRWPHLTSTEGSSPSQSAWLNLSLKISVLYSQIHPADPDGAIDSIAGRLRAILRRAKEVGAFVNFDMEQYALKDLTLRLFKSIFAEPEFRREPACGLALQAYLKDSERDLRDVLAWAHGQDRRIGIRLVKGAYWDYEVVVAGQKGWPIPVFKEKAQTDDNYERLSLVLLEHQDVVEPAFGTHNVRSIAHALAQAERLGVAPGAFEFQMLYGMANATKKALVQLGHRVREYCPVGELLPGMAYLVRRLLENTSNEGFLARNAAKKVSREELLEKPLLHSTSGPSSLEPPMTVLALDPSHEGFQNEPPTDFTIQAERLKIAAALALVRRALGRKHPLVINNKAVETSVWLPSLNPANQLEVVGYSAQGTIQNADAALEAARQARLRWARTPVAERAAFLQRVAGLLRVHKAELCAWEVLEAGKNWSESDADVAEAIDFCNFYGAVMRNLGSPHLTQRVPGESNIQHWWPRGTGLVIAPWNFPLAILTGMTVAAVVTGNTVLMKPSDQTPVLAARLMGILMEAGLPNGVVNLLTGPGASMGAHLVAHPHIDFIAFTGSKEVGLRIWEAAGRTLPGQAGLKKVICEMGGKNAIIVDNDADLDEAVAGVIASAFGYQGQKCSALSRLIVLAENYEHFLARLVGAAASLRVGPAEEPGTIIGPVISREAQQRILGAIEAGKSEARLMWQGEVPDDPNACYVPPTIFTEVPATSRLFREEIFGPVLSVTRARDFDQAIALANAAEFALTGGLYSRSPVNIECAKNELVCGNVYINRPITGAIVERQPFGGFNMSGGGTKAGGREYLLNFMVPRVVTENLLRRGFAPLNNGPKSDGERAEPEIGNPKSEIGNPK